jgi:hypothetical protein
MSDSSSMKKVSTQLTELLRCRLAFNEAVPTVWSGLIPYTKGWCGCCKWKLNWRIESLKLAVAKYTPSRMNGVIRLRKVFDYHILCVSPDSAHNIASDSQSLTKSTVIHESKWLESTPLLLLSPSREAVWIKSTHPDFSFWAIYIGISDPATNQGLRAQ